MGNVSNWEKENPQKEVERQSKLKNHDELYGVPFCINDLEKVPDDYNKNGKWRVFIILGNAQHHFYINGAWQRNSMLNSWLKRVQQGEIIHGVTLSEEVYEKTGKHYPEIADILGGVCPCGVTI